MPMIAMLGNRFGRLLVVAAAQRAGRRAMWVCLCDCGATKEIQGAHLRSGATKSCGCLLRESTIRANTEHGMTGTPTHNVWKNMLQRCGNPNHPSYPHYGGRGVSVCDRWKDSFSNFLHDMGERPLGMTIDRIENDRGYEPGNCRWATRAVQAVNRAVVQMVTIGDRTQCVTHWLNETGVSRAAFHRRVAAGWPIEDAISIRQLKAQHYHLRPRQDSILEQHE